MGKDRYGKSGRSGESEGAGLGYQLPALAWAAEELEAPEPELESETAPEQSPEKSPEPAAELVPEIAGEAAPEGDADTDGEPKAPAFAATDGLAAATAASAQATASTRPGRISKPMIAAAATAGVVLIGLPLVLSHLGGGGAPGGPSAGAPPGYTQQSGGGDGFVPKADAHGDIGPGGPQAPGQPPQGGTGGAGGNAGGAPGAAPIAAAGAAGAGTALAPVGSGSGGGTNANAGGAGAPQQQGQSQSQPQPNGQPQQPGQPQPQPQPQTQPNTQTQPQQPAPPPAPTKAAPPPAPSYSGVAGPFCANSGTTFQQNGWFDQGQAGWVTNSGNSGCGGRFNSMPMSGASGKDSGNSVVWTFSTGAVSSGSCTLSVYVPSNSDIKAVGGAPAYYTVQTGSSPGSGTIGSFTVNQVGNRGEWVDAGTYPVSNGRIGVMLHDRGQDWTNTAKTYAHLAAAAVKADCTG